MVALRNANVYTSQRGGLPFAVGRFMTYFCALGFALATALAVLTVMGLASLVVDFAPTFITGAAFMWVLLVALEAALVLGAMAVLVGTCRTAQRNGRKSYTGS